MSVKILLLEDDILFADTLQDMLDEEGFEVVVCHNGQEALDLTYRSKFDLYLLDINVPLIDGLTLLKELRIADDTTPAIYLTSHKDKDIVRQGFENGADDYLKKPFDSDELIWRIEALIRRFKGDKTRCVGELCLDEKHLTILHSGLKLNLSKKEYMLLSLLMQNASQIVTKEMIVNELWSTSESVSDGAIRVYINRLKQLLGSKMIENIRGIGYRLVS